MKKGWQQIMLYLIVLTSYGCLSDEDKCIRQLVQGRYLPSKRFRLMFSNYYSRQRLWQLHSGGNGQYQGSNRHDICLYV